ncbi:MAG TPA: hypothetical protein VFF44_00140, partial [Casimicrobiaceae bacterium]|nr:hypothetical protein [Casimicrobiaceae bacterium]
MNAAMKEKYRRFSRFPRHEASHTLCSAGAHALRMRLIASNDIKQAFLWRKSRGLSWQIRIDRCMSNGLETTS